MALNVGRARSDDRRAWRGRHDSVRTLSGAARMESITTAADMARLRGIDPKRFRAALRRVGLPWHSHDGRWEVRVGSPEHCDLVRVLATLEATFIGLSVGRIACRKTTYLQSIKRHFGAWPFAKSAETGRMPRAMPRNHGAWPETG